MIGFSCFKDYVLIKTHFSEPKFFFNRNFNYDRISVEAFRKRNDQKLFALVENKIPLRDDRIEEIISLFLFDNESYIADMVLEHKSDEFHQKRMRIVNSLESQFRQDCQRLEFWLDENQKLFSEICLTNTTDPCIIIKNLKEIDISIETVCLLNQYSGFLEEWFPINFLWKNEKHQYVKYQKLLMQMDKDVTVIEKHYNRLALAR